MSFIFLDNFNGSAVVGNALAGHTPDTAPSGTKLTASSGYDSLDGSGFLYCTSGTFNFISPVLSTPGVVLPATFVVGGITGAFGGSYPIDDTGGSKSLLFELSAGTRFVAATIRNQSTSYTQPIGHNQAEGSVTIPPGPSIMVSMILSGDSTSGYETWYGYAALPAGPWTVTLTLDVTGTTVSVNGSTLISTSYGITSFDNLNGLMFPGQAIDSLSFNGTSAPIVTSAFWTKFVGTLETP